MRIAYVSTYLPQKCGIATYTGYLIHGLRKVNPALEIKVVAENGALPVKQGKFEVIPCWDRNENYVEPILNNVKDVDIVHIQHEYNIYNFDDRLPNVLEGLNGSAKKIITIHCVRPGQFSERGVVDENFVKSIAELADVVIVHLDSQRAILERLGIPSEKIHVIAHGSFLSDADKKISRARLKLPEEGKIILMFGFVKPFKGIHFALEVLDAIREEIEDVYLFIAGSLAPNASKEGRDYIEFIRKRIIELELHDKVIFPNRFIPNEDIPFIFGASDVVLLPYYHNDRSASGSIHLAIGAKKPVIASRIPKFEELKNICDELLVIPYSTAMIARAIIRLFDDKEFEQYVLDRTERYRRAISWPVIASQHMELYRGGA